MTDQRTKDEAASARVNVSADVWTAQQEAASAMLAALKPFASAFDKAGEKYIKRYGSNQIIGRQNFDAMPDRWPMEGLQFDMGTFRLAIAAIAAAEAAGIRAKESQP